MPIRRGAATAVRSRKTDPCVHTDGSVREHPARRDAVAPGRVIPVKPSFMFATGIENSYPTVSGGRTRVDEMEKHGHNDLRRTDFNRVEALGFGYL